MPAKNIHGLSREIPTSVKRQVRQNSKFGCVVPNCRNSFYEYEHIIPEFKDAKIHDPECICLVCPNHNPRKIGKYKNENYSKEQIRKFYDKIKNNTDVPEPKNSDFFNYLRKDVKIIIGTSSFQNIDSIINVNGINVFSFQKNTDESFFASELTFSGTFQDSQGNKLFEIKENEWSSPTYHWDIETLSGVVKIWDKTKDLVFHAIKIPQENTINIVHLNMYSPPFHITIIDNDLAVGRYSEDGKDYIYIALNADYRHGKCGIYLNKYEYFNRPVMPDPIFEMKGGEGVTMPGNGIWLGRGCGKMLIRTIKIYNSDTITTAKVLKPNKKIIPPDTANYFIKGKLIIETIEMPNWKEELYFINGQRLENRPYSWGVINDEGAELYYIDRNEPSDLSMNSGFIGFYADDILKMDWSDNIFEAIIEEIDNYGNVFHNQIKRSKTVGRKVISEVNPETQKYYHPHQFAGISPWK